MIILFIGWNKPGWRRQSPRILRCSLIRVISWRCWTTSLPNLHSRRFDGQQFIAQLLVEGGAAAGVDEHYIDILGFWHVDTLLNGACNAISETVRACIERARQADDLLCQQMLAGNDKRQSTCNPRFSVPKQFPKINYRLRVSKIWYKYC
ncbi:hypothetical protein AB4Z32_21100 [Massilia sp. 2TAF26]|uniref:hypothetical protein n=1 Tax=Massilia sp. 2TAF26 TaxID=3233012 RepID=UPI003F99D699